MIIYFPVNVIKQLSFLDSCTLWLDKWNMRDVDISQVTICENDQWKAKLTQDSAKSVVLNHWLPTLRDLSSMSPTYSILVYQHSQQMCRGVGGAEQRGERCYLQGPFWKDAYISSSPFHLEIWHRGRDEVSLFCHRYLCSAFDYVR